MNATQHYHPSTIRRFFRRLWRNEEGVAFLEFILVLYAFLFLLLGVVQVAMMALASFYTNYGNFMALRTAAVWYEPYQNEFISKGDFEDKCKEGALMAMAPIERYYYKTNSGSAKSNALNRITFIYEEDTSMTDSDGRAAMMKGRLEYDYQLWVPFVGRVISGLQKSGVPQASRTTNAWAYDKEGGGSRYPTVKLRSNNDLNTGESSPRTHKTLLQRRWKFPVLQD